MALRVVTGAADALRGRRIFCRVDFNVPLRGGRIADAGRIRTCVPTLKFLLGRGAKVALATHLGDPHGVWRPELRTRLLRGELESQLGRPVRHVEHFNWAALRTAVRALPAGEVLLLENVRFNAGEIENDPCVARRYASLADLFVNEGFSVSHRNHASVAGVAQHLTAYAGLGLADELASLARIGSTPPERSRALLGGNKVEKLRALPRLLQAFGVTAVGGALGFALAGAPPETLWRAGTVPTEFPPIPSRRETARLSSEGRLLLPVDAVVSGGGEGVRQVPLAAVRPGLKVHDIGRATRAAFASIFSGAEFVLWNGPLGEYEKRPFIAGTAHVARAACSSGAFVMTGGGDTSAAVRALGLDRRVGYRSGGGGALVAYLQGLPMPGLCALYER